ncbi:hypothetical protein K461DRAFT_291108 [Myriangium duriaei CBS 260.36]|uniref:Myb-like domain-containing protein n=1 Tax=Myriangium duriaei CBS 260.36 TaxID=1168546 RepID=A0A9P4MKB5_9PEZI|nr:hypothetical protein K461DRAFT_291108 [Myriangium duriaei CBS 260.36]
MSVHPRPNPPWTQYEKLELMTEIIKALNISPDQLLSIVRSNSEPPWEHMSLPMGRSLAQCKAMYQEYVVGLPPQSHQRPVEGIRGQPYALDARPTPQQVFLPEGPPPVVPMVNTRYPEIQPRPPNYTGGHGIAMSPSSEPPRKKRGRPTKAESELRKEAAKARGESVGAFRRDTVHAGSSHGPTSVAAQAAQAVMGPAQLVPRPATATPETLPINRKRPLSGEAPEGAPRAPASTDDDSGTQTQGPPLSSSRPSFRDYPQILTQDPAGGTSTFRAPRGGE